MSSHKKRDKMYLSQTYRLNNVLSHSYRIANIKYCCDSYYMENPPTSFQKMPGTNVISVPSLDLAAFHSIPS